MERGNRIIGMASSPIGWRGGAQRSQTIFFFYGFLGIRIAMLSNCGIGGAALRESLVLLNPNVGVKASNCRPMHCEFQGVESVRFPPLVLKLNEKSISPDSVLSFFGSVLRRFWSKEFVPKV